MFKDKKIIIKLTLGLLLPTIFSGQVFAKNSYAKGELLIATKAGVSDAQLELILEKHTAKKKKRIQLKDSNIHLITVPENAERGIVNALSKNPNIEFAELNELVPVSEVIPNDPRYSDAWHLSKINMSKAWDISKGEGIVVAVLDSGIYPHADLSANLLTGYNTVSNNTDTSDSSGHGTLVAGVIAAISNNNIGVTSIAWNSKILPVKISNASDGYAYASDIAQGIAWAADNGADIVNISYQVSHSFTVTSAAQSFYNQGGLVVASAGNSGAELNCSDNAVIITVSATGSDDNKTSWSNYGNCIDVAAPGSSIYTTHKSGGYSQANGTSFSAPVTAAVLALMKAKYPQLTNRQLEELLESSADKTVSGTSYSKFYGHGRIDAFSALTSVIDAPEVDQVAPVATVTSPVENSSNNATIEILVSATDNVGVNKVELYIEGTLIGTDNSAPFSFVYDSSSHVNQEVAIEAKAFDAENNIGSSGIHWIYFDNTPEPEPADTQAPTVTITNFVDGSSISSNTTFNVRATDNKGVIKTELFIDGQLKSQTSSGVLDYSWNVRKVNAGSHQIVTKAYDAAGNSAQETYSVNVVTSTKGNKGKKRR
ncbi:S8 family serine peptidase [Thalassomonas sp. M1454]|uniref:S8 family serine peptidase n=1 Tax=Thalassomonas sp. M1454 TaxID=2594477 RepID=UPI00117BF47E|nr:S8 family serine peptidase [Thalassomonas sp. M1454]TRX53138.1 S8 family serine peptidase [Thalassomonas sp. M1454]